MAFLDFVRPKRIVGLDMGSFALKLVELVPRKKGKETRYELAALAYEPVPHQAIVEGSIMDSTAVVDAIQHCFYESKTKAGRLAFGVSGNSVIVKRIDVSRRPPEEMHEHIMWEAQPHISFSSEEINLDYETFDAPDLPPDRVGVLLAAVKKDKLNDYLNAVNLAQKVADVVDLESFAVTNSVLYNYPNLLDRTAAIINVGASITNVVIVKAGYPVFVRDIAFGGNQFTDLLQKELNLPFEKAEVVKKGRQVEGVAPASVKSVVGIMFGELKSEIHKTLDFYRNNSSDGRIDTVLVSGGTASMDGLVDGLAQELDLAVEVADPFRNIDVNEKKIFNLDFVREMAPVFNVAVGLALRTTGDKK